MLEHRQTSTKRETPPQATGFGATDNLDNTQFEQSFVDFLIAENIVDYVILERATSAAHKTGERLDRVLTKLGLVSESNLAAALRADLSCGGPAYERSHRALIFRWRS